MKKIAIVFPKDSESIFNKNSRNTFGGASVQLFLIARELNCYRDFEVYSLINEYPVIDFDEKHLFNIVTTYKRKDPAFIKVLKFHRAIQRIKPDIVIQRGLSPFSCLLALYCRLFGIKFIFMFAHDREARGHYQKTNNPCPLFRLLVGNASLLIFQSESQIGQFKGKCDSRCRLILSGNEIRSLNGFRKEYILWVGRVEEWKRPEIFLEIAEKNPEKKFVMISPPVPLRNGYFAGIIKRAQSIKNLTMVDFVRFSDIDEYFEKALLFINTSVEEGFPNTFIQACKSRTPILSLNVNPGSFLDKYRCGLCCENDAELLNNEMNRLIGDHELLRQMGENAFKNSCTNHDIRRNVKTLLEMIEETV